MKGKDSNLYIILAYEIILNALKIQVFAGFIHSFICKYLLRPDVSLNAKNIAVNKKHKYLPSVRLYFCCVERHSKQTKTLNM